jgi:hypothetical protein
LDYIANKIKKYEADRPYKNRDNFYYAREDIAFVIKYLYRKRVFLVNRRVRENYPAAYKRNLKYTRYNLILFKTKKDFPENPHFK